MKYIIKEVNYNDVDFKKLCAELDEFQNKIIPWRTELGVSGLSGLEKLQKVLLMYDGDKVIVSAALKPIDETTAEIARVYTEEQYRGKGLAQVLVNRIIEFAKDFGYKKLVLDTWKESVSARKLYSKMGFKEVPIFGIEVLEESCSTKDKEMLKKALDALVYMEKDI